MYKKLCNIINMSSMQFKQLQNGSQSQQLINDQSSHLNFQMNSSINFDSKLDQKSDVSSMQQNSIGSLIESSQANATNNNIHGFYKFVLENDL